MGKIADAAAAARHDQMAATAKMNVAVHDLQSRAEKAERELEALLSFSEGREHKCDDACSWAHSEYVKFIFKEARDELEAVLKP